MIQNNKKISSSFLLQNEMKKNMTNHSLEQELFKTINGGRLSQQRFHWVK